MNEKLTKVFKSTGEFLGKHSPEILTGIGVAGMITSTVLAVKATPRALELINAERMAREEAAGIISGETVLVPDLTKLEMVKIAWKPYIPSVILAVASMSCIIGASAVNAKRNAALATAYAISERTLIRYRDKVIDTIGEKKEKEIRENVAQDKVTENKKVDSQIIITSKGNTLCMDAMTNRYFKSDLDQIRKVVNELNRKMLHEHYISLNDLYYELNLDPIKNGSLLGWNLDNGLIEVEFSTCLAENDEPCVVIDYTVAPRYDYDKLM